jgi:DNA polymerase
MSLKPVFDILNAGPRRRFTILTERGPLIVHNCGYEGGVAAFLTFAAVYGMDLDALAEAVWDVATEDAIDRAKGMLAWFQKHRRSTHGLSEKVWIACEILVLAWRDAHSNTKALWAAARDAVTQAIGAPGTSYRFGKYLVARKDGTWLRIRLPSGRYLCYLHPEVNDKGEISYTGVDPYTRQWRRTKTYGGKLIENCTQAAARDVLAGQLQPINDAGYSVVLTVHDEVLCETPDSPEFNVEDLSGMLSAVPPWAAGLPLAAAGFETKVYHKE